MSVPIEARPPDRGPFPLQAAVLATVDRWDALGIREETPNESAFLRRLRSYFGQIEPSPWCTMAAVKIQHESAESLGRVSTAPWLMSGAKLWRWAMRNPDKCTLIRNMADLRPGDVVILGSTRDKASRIRAGRLASGHTYTATTPADADRRGRHESAEGNTNKRGSREGDGFFRRFRYWDDPRLVGAIRFQAVDRDDGRTAC